MYLKEVTDKRSARTFLNVARDLYLNDPNWVCPPDNMVEGIFNPEVNVFWSHGEAVRWILYNNNHKAIGRVAAFINRKKAYNFSQPTGGMGFFECIDDKKAAFLLFDTCKAWLKDRGMEAMDGPVNFGENDNFWGLLVEGFMPPSFGMNYNPPYYKGFFEDYGFRPYFDQVTNHLNLRKPFPERFWKIADWVRQKPGYSFRHFNWKDSGKFIEDFKSIYDDAWQFHENFTPIDPDDLRKSLNELKPIMDEEFIWFAYVDENPAAFLVMIPDANQIFRYLNGKLNFWGKLKFWFYSKRNVFTRTRITVMGVRPKYQKSGIESAIFWHMEKVMNKRPWYSEVELSWVGDFNPKMKQLHESVGSDFAKRHITYRYLFNAPGESQKATVIPMDTRNQTKEEE